MSLVSELIEQEGGTSGETTLQLPSGREITVYVPRAGEFEAFQARSVDWAGIGIKAAKNAGHLWHEFKDLLREEWQLAFLVSKIVRDGGPITELDALSLVKNAGGLCQYIREQVEAMSKTSKVIWYNHFFEDYKKKSPMTQSDGLNSQPAEMSGDVTPPN